MSKRGINEKLDRLRDLIQDEDFLKGRGLSNEVNIRIMCYHPKDEMAVRHFIGQIKADKGIKCNVREYNLYHLFLKICEEKRILDKIPGMEEKRGKSFLLGQLQRIASAKEFVARMDYDDHQEGDVIIIDGIGEVFPFMRVHTLLENMQPYFGDVPVVVMYPGNFDGNSLKLFNEFKPNSYYRAFNIV